MFIAVKIKNMKSGCGGRIQFLIYGNDVLDKP